MKVLTSVFLTLISHFAFAAVEEAPLPDKIEFNRDVRPILSENCFHCHGFDKNTREANRRLDTSDGACADQDGVIAISPGNLAKSEVHHRIISHDKDERMPPEEAGKKLKPREIALINKWIEQGAKYEPHWAYVPPVKPVPLALSDAMFVRNPIDGFVLARQREIGLQHSAEADRRTLIRRLTLDLTGLPPTSAETEAFLSDPTLDAYEKAVDRLLASPAYGERMAVYWLDLVRYADTIGYHSDNARNIHPYRDYVIRAFNENLPFDQFTIEQLAGDLLPGATIEQRVATGYTRLNMTTEEGGAQPREYEAKAVGDRVRSIGTTWLAQTTGCAECHDHKFDPIRTRDFYRLGAFFADLKEESVGRRENGLLVAPPETAVKLEEFDDRIAALKGTLAKDTPEIIAARDEWMKPFERSLEAPIWSALHPQELISENGATFLVEESDLIRVTPGAAGGAETFRIKVGSVPREATAFQLEALKSSRHPAQGPGLADNGNFVLTEINVATVSADGTERPVRLAHAEATFEQRAYSAAAVIDGVIQKADNGWGVMGKIGEDHALLLELAERLPEDAAALVFTMRHDYGANHIVGQFRLSATASQNPLPPAGLGKLPDNVRDAIKTAADQRTDAHRSAIAEYFRTITSLLGATRDKLASAEKERGRIFGSIPRSLVAESMKEFRTVRVLARGNWQDESGEIVQPGVPGFLATGREPGDRRLTRLDLAQWIVSRENPLTARVFVNRLWKLFFGAGLSKVLDDLGAQGELPANPALLDWLACDFMESGWDVKKIVRTIVTSGVYRQTSNASEELRQRDPFNREMARQSRFRLDAEFVRDNALAISGLLARKVGGPSVKPYQPASYWENLNFPAREWDADKGENQWRRGIYTWWQRSYLHPSLLAFDAPSREECTAERVRSNIPQQALALLNDPSYVEAARVFAVRIVQEGGADAAQRIDWAYREALARPPRPEEIRVVSELYQRHLQAYEADIKAARALLQTGFAPQPSETPPEELAAWTSVARVILNLHETITRS